jgi:hypothetical protein
LIEGEIPIPTSLRGGAQRYKGQRRSITDKSPSSHHQTLEMPVRDLDHGNRQYKVMYMAQFNMKKVLQNIVGIGGLLAVSTGWAHHTYAMFDDSQTATVQGTVAKLEWTNPHVYIWIYVPKAHEPGKFDLFAFENASINVLTRIGWTKTMLKIGERIAVEYYPLKDGRAGGHFIKATLADGRVVQGAGGPGVRVRLP